MSLSLEYEWRQTFSSPPPCPEHTGCQWVVIILCFYLVSKGHKMTLCCIAYKDCFTRAELLKELIFNKTVLAPFQDWNPYLFENIRKGWFFHKILLKTCRFNLVFTKSLEKILLRQNWDLERAQTCCRYKRMGCYLA